MANSRPLPTALKKLRGNPGKEKLNEFEPMPSSKLPPCPAYLSPGAKAAWHDIAPELNRLGVLTSVDVNCFARYCDLHAEWLLCVEYLKNNGPDLIIHDAEGQVTCVQPTPFPKRKAGIAAEMLRLEQEFGMTPASRSKLKAIPVDGGDELDQILNAPSMKIAQ